MKWPRVDKYHSHCSRCNVVFRNSQLRDDLCENCLMTESQENASIAVRSNSKVVTKAATKILSSLKEKGRDGQAMPVIMNTFFNAIGGVENFGHIIREEFEKARGIGLTESEEEVYEPDFKLRMHWIDMLSRIQKQVDTDKSLDVGSLEESDLEAILSSIALKSFQEDPSLQLAVITQAVHDPAICRKVFEACIRADRSLVTEILESGGQIVDAVSVETKLDSENITVEEDDDYDPSADEYKEVQ